MINEPLLARPRVSVTWIAWLAGLVPIFAAHAAYLLAIAEEQAPACIPYWDGCVSISRAARYGNANHLFKAMMLPYSGVLMLYWALCWHWLHQLDARRRRRQDAMLVLGVIGALFLILYATFLGVKGDIYEWLRRYGTTVYFSFTVLAQMLLTSLIAGETRIPHALRRAKVGLCLTMLLLGLASIPLQHLAANRSAMVNAIEWTYAVLMMAFFPLTAQAWRASGLGIHFQLARPGNETGPEGPARTAGKDETLSP